MKQIVWRTFHWLEELNYNARSFSDEWRQELQRRLASSDREYNAREYLLGAIERCDELRKAACELLALIDESTNRPTRGDDDE